MLIKQEDNVAIILEELHAIDGLSRRFRGIPEIPDVPCPFAVSPISCSCRLGQLSSAMENNHTYPMFRRWKLQWGARKEVRVLVRISQPHIVLISIDVPDNNNEITVIDITEPKNPPTVFSLPGRILS